MTRTLLLRLAVIVATCTSLLSCAGSGAQPSPLSEAIAPADRFAVLIGVNECDDPRFVCRLVPFNDSQDLRSVLTRAGAFPEENVLTITSREATHDNVLQTLTTLVNHAPENSLILIAFSGFGFAKDSQLYLLPYNGVTGRINGESALPLDLITKIISSRPSLRSVLVLDTSFRLLDESPLSSPLPITSGLAHIQNKEAIYLPSDSIYEDMSPYQGPFMQEVVHGLDGAAKNDHGDITKVRLADYTNAALPASPHMEQVPHAKSQYALNMPASVISSVPRSQSKSGGPYFPYLAPTTIRSTIEFPEASMQTFHVDDKGDCPLLQTTNTTFCVDWTSINEIGKYHISVAGCDFKPSKSSVNGRCGPVGYFLSGCRAEPSCTSVRTSFEIPVDVLRSVNRTLGAFEPPK